MGRLPDQPGQAGSRRVAMAQFRCWVLQARISNLPHGILHWAPPAQLGMQYVYCSVPPLSAQCSMGRLPDQPGQAGSRRVAMAQSGAGCYGPEYPTCPMGFCTGPPRPSWECSRVYCSVPPPLSAQYSSVCPRFALMLGCDRVQSVIMTLEVLPPPPALAPLSRLT